MVSSDIFTATHTPLESINEELPKLYGFPFANKSSAPWEYTGERHVYLYPLLLDTLFYSCVISLFLLWLKPLITFPYRKYVAIIISMVFIWLAGIELVFTNNHFLPDSPFNSELFHVFFNFYGN